MSKRAKKILALFLFGCLCFYAIGNSASTNETQAQIGIMLLGALSLFFYVNRFRVYSAIGRAINYVVEKYWFVVWPAFFILAVLIIYGIVIALI